MKRNRWERMGRIVVELQDPKGERFKVMVGETCGAPTKIVADWITDIHNYQILPWYKRLFKRTPKYGNYQFEFVEDW